MTRVGFVVPVQHPLPLGEQVSLVREAETRGYDSAWVFDGNGPDALTMVTYLVAATERLNVSTGITPVQTRSPVTLGITAATLGHLAPGRVALGLGISSRIIIGQWHGLPFLRPAAQLREAVSVIRTVLAGERVNFDGEFYHHKNFRLNMPPPPRPVPIYLGALGPKMLQLAGEIADGLVLNWVPLKAIPGAIGQVEIGAKRAGRSLDGFEIACFVRVSVTDHPEPARAWLARDITGYCIVDSYARFFRDCGYGAEVDAVNGAWQAGDRQGAVKQVSPKMLDGLGIVGPEQFCQARLEEFAKAGGTRPVVFPFSADPDPRATLLRTLRTFPL
jgi:probable F420-dependent oxidoreductase